MVVATVAVVVASIRLNMGKVGPDPLSIGFC